jgi:hypothetical protein
MGPSCGSPDGTIDFDNWVRYFRPNKEQHFYGGVHEVKFWILAPKSYRSINFEGRISGYREWLLLS